MHLLSDGLGGDGDVRLLVTATAAGFAVLASYEYDAFGAVLSASGPDAASNFFRFRGTFQDPATGLALFGHRWHDPATGVFLSRDSGSPNFYSVAAHNAYPYCGHDPVNRIDRTGDDWDAIVSGAKELYNDGKQMLVDAAPYIDRGIQVISGVKSTIAGFGMMVGGSFLAAEGAVTTPLGGVGLLSIAGGGALIVLGKYEMSNGLTSIVNGVTGSNLPGAWESQFGRNSVTFVLDNFGGGPPTTKFDAFISGYTNADAFHQRYSPSASLGGVYLSTTAQLVLSLRHLSGATFDAATGQLLLFGDDGQRDVQLPGISLDMALVAARAVLGGEDPGVRSVAAWQQRCRVWLWLPEPLCRVAVTAASILPARPAT